jgi:hypothetical protein
MHGRIVANLFGKHRGKNVKLHPLVLRPPALKSPLEQKSIPYRLQVETIMRRKDLPTLARGGKELVALIESTNTLNLLHASMEINNEEVRLFHYWNMNYDADNLTLAELRLPDMPAYARFDRLIVDEIKDIVIPTARSRFVPIPEQVFGQRYVYFMSTFQVRSENLAEFQAHLEGNVIPFADRNGWFLGDSFLGITGLAGRITQLWIVPENAVTLAPARLAAAPWQGLLRSAPTYKFLEPLPPDPFLGEQAMRDWQGKVAGAAAAAAKAQPPRKPAPSSSPPSSSRKPQPQP